MRLRLVPVLTATLLCGSLAATDLTITFTSKRKGLAGTGGAGNEVHYYTPVYQMIQGVDSKVDQLVDFSKGISYSIDHKKKTVSKLSFDDAMAAMESMNKQAPAGSGNILGTLFGDPNSCKVEKLGRETIAGRDCQDWRITVGKLTMDLSADPTLKLPMTDTAYTLMMKTRAAQLARSGPMGASFKRLYEEMAKIKGIPLKTHITGLMGLDMATEATGIASGPVPPATFTFPSDYKVEDMGLKLKSQMAKHP